MPNANTCFLTIRLPGAAQGASSTAEFQFQNKDGGNAVLTVPAGILNGRRQIILRAGGRVTGGTTTNFTGKVYLGATIAGTLVFSSGAIAVNSASGNWFLEVAFVIDATSDKIQGIGYGNVNATAVAQANVSVTSADPETVLQFCASGQFSASHASSAAYLDFLEMDVM